jgi:chromosome segregation ATPase
MTEIEELVRDREYWIERAKQKDETISVIRAEMERLRGELEKVSKERDEALSLAARGDVAKALLSQIDSALNDAGVPTLHPDIGAAERKPMLLRERVEWLENEWSEARFQVQRLKAELRTAEGEWKHWKRIADHRKEKIIAMVARPEPSRLEIAADLLCAWEGHPDIAIRECNPVTLALRMADELIAAAKEEVQQ